MSVQKQRKPVAAVESRQELDPSVERFLILVAQILRRRTIE